MFKEEGVITAGEVAKVERQKQIEVIDARKVAKREAVAITVTAEATKKAAQAPVVSTLLNELGLGGSLEELVSGDTLATPVAGKTAAGSTDASDLVDNGVTKQDS